MTFIFFEIYANVAKQSVKFTEKKLAVIKAVNVTVKVVNISSFFSKL